MDAGKFYALLRMEEASLALRSVLRLGLVEQMGEKAFSINELQTTLGLTKQAARTFFVLLQVMGILHREADCYKLTRLAFEALSDSARTSRKPYLQMGSGPEVDELIDLMRGERLDESLPLYSAQDGTRTLMDEEAVGREIAYGLSSRARNFATPLAAVLAVCRPQATSLADIGAGSPYIAEACLNAMQDLEDVELVDRSNGMQFARELIEIDRIDSSRMRLVEADFFKEVPSAEVYILSNTAHDWRPVEYQALMDNVRRAIVPGGLVCIHEPLLLDTWDSEQQWFQALWMACYAMTLLKLTHGAGTCYSLREHHEILARSGFVPVGEAHATVDGCTALFYECDSQAH